MNSNSKKGKARRNFLKNSGLAGLGSLFSATSVMASASAHAEMNSKYVHSVTDSTFSLLITTDLHAQVNTHDEFFWEEGKPVFRKRGGLAVLKSMVDSLRKKNPNSLLIDGGDYFHGHALATLTEGEALIPLLNAFKYDLLLPGNWEVVYKKKKMLYDLGHSNATKICANMWHDTQDETKGELIYPPFYTKYLAGAKIGFLGYTDHLVPKRQSPAYSLGIKYTHADFNLSRYVKYLKEVEGCGIIFLVTHMGLAQQVGLSNNPACEGVDFILGADTHERVRVPIEGKFAKVVECGAFGSFLGKLDVVVANGKIDSYKYQLLDVDPKVYPPDKSMQQQVDRALAPYQSKLSEVIGFSSTPLMRYFVLETPMDNLITDALHWKFKTDIALSNGFRFCQPLAVDPISKQAKITREFLWNMLPVNSVVRQAQVSGQQILDWLEKELQNAFAKNPANRFGGWFVRFAGMEVNMTIGNELGKRVNQVKINGTIVQKDTTYSVVACEREGDPKDTLCRIEKVSNPNNMQVDMHAVIEEYLATHSPVAPKLEGRAIATDQPLTLLTQLQGTNYEFK